MVLLSSGEPGLANSDGFMEGTRNKNPILNLSCSRRVRNFLNMHLRKQPDLEDGALPPSNLVDYCPASSKQLL